MALRLTPNQGDHRFRAQGPVFAVALLVLVIAGGTAGYMLTEGLGAWEALYTAVLAVTTVESRPGLSRTGQRHGSGGCSGRRSNETTHAFECAADRSWSGHPKAESASRLEH